MNVKMRELLQSALLTKLTLLFIVSYLFWGVSGIFGGFSEGFFRLLHKSPAVISMLVLLANLSARLAAGLKARGKDAASGSGSGPGLSGFVHAGLILFILGAFVSGLTRFEGTVVAAEGQTLDGDEAGFLPGTLYKRPLASNPLSQFAMLEVDPRYKPNRTAAWFVKAKAKLAGSGDIVLINSVFPVFAKGATLFSIKDFGFAPMYRLSHPDGRVFDEAFLLFKLFPPGNEDYFRLVTTPETFYLRYFPEAPLAQDRIASGKRGPLYKLRVTKNLAVIFNGYLSYDEPADLRAFKISFSEPRRWAKLHIVRDYGLFLMAPGAFLAFFSALAAVWRKY
ncbi:MAG: hypothetical protein EPN22_04805 [Nitrospirae bacterium]|nr:MAG: hypothetical protein EPN22_04805 [Nitrospirota bacterium]